MKRTGRIIFLFIFVFVMSVSATNYKNCPTSELCYANGPTAVGLKGCVSSDISSNGFTIVNTYSEPAYIGYLTNINCLTTNNKCSSCGSGSSTTTSCWHCAVAGAVWNLWTVNDP